MTTRPQQANLRQQPLHSMLCERLINFDTLHAHSRIFNTDRLQQPQQTAKHLLWPLRRH